MSARRAISVASRLRPIRNVPRIGPRPLAVENGLRINQHHAGGKQHDSQQLAVGMGVAQQQRARCKIRPETLRNFPLFSRRRVVGLGKHLPAVEIEDDERS